MVVIPFPTSGLSGVDLRLIEDFCVERRERGLAAYLSVGRIYEPGADHPGLRYASIKDAPEGKTLFIIDRTNWIYYVRYFDTSLRKILVVARGRRLSQVLELVPDCPVIGVAVRRHD